MTAAARLALACALAAAPGVGSASPAFESVVLVRCAMAGGEAKATGFVWPEPGRIVTALHAVAGCEEIVVWSEASGREALAWIDRVDLEADLALLALDDDLGLKPVSFAPDPPDVTADHVTMGYPLAAEQMIRMGIEFGGGLRSDVTTLGDAFASAELETLFRDQPYPTRDTSILRVNSTIQPGHSGAPIFDASGAVVAIVDGGLLGGWRTINWSIPAHLYLPDLLASEDPPPEGPSHQAQLFSAVSEEEATQVAFGAMAEAGGEEGTLHLVRQVGLLEFAELNGLDGESSIVDDIRQLIQDEARLASLAFDIYEEASSGATIGVPEGSQPWWNAERGVIEARNPTENVFLAVTLGRSASFAEAVEVDLTKFAGDESAYAYWAEGEDPSGPVFSYYDEALESAEHLSKHTGAHPETGESLEMTLHVFADGADFIGTSVRAVNGAENFGPEDRLDYLLMDFGATFLTNLAPTEESTQAAPGGVADELDASGVLHLVRRIGLLEFAELNGLDGEGSIVDDIRQLLQDDAQLASLAFDIYECPLTGAAVGVPEGTELYWNEERGVIEASNPQGSAYLAVRVGRADSFVEAVEVGLANFAGEESGYAYWAEGEDPSGPVFHHYDEEHEFAGLVRTHTGEQPETGASVEMILGLFARGPEFIGTSVFAVDGGEASGPEGLVDYRMMEFGATFLTDFALN